jgi:hypothetical protein
VRTKDTAVCDQITYPIIKDLCNLKITGDASSCESLSNEFDSLFCKAVLEEDQGLRRQLAKRKTVLKDAEESAEGRFEHIEQMSEACLYMSGTVP